MEKFKIALAQIESEPGNQEANLLKMLDYVKKAGNEDCGMVVFPEMCLPGYMIMDGKDFHNFFALATDFKDAATRALVEEARHNNINVIYGAPTKSPNLNGIFYNSAILITPEGEIKCYNKTHLPTSNSGGTIFYEGLYCKHGTEFPVFDLKNIKMGMIVCYDTLFPEPSRILAAKGAELIVIISASPVTSKKTFETILPARALENVSYLAYVNVVGEQKGLTFFGGSRVLSPLGTQMALLSHEKEDFGVAELDPEALSGLRKSLFFLRDRGRRPEIYRELCEDFG
jgi:predicted amidohydrolase